MLNRHRNGSFSSSLARAVPAARFARASAPLLATLSFVVASGAVHYAPALGGGTEIAAVAIAQEPGVGFLDEKPAASASAPAPAHQPPRLSAEQQNVARFIATRYRLAADQTQVLVGQAYRIAREAKLDPWLVLAVISVESSFDPKARSSKGAQGLMQVLTRVHADKFAPFGGVAAAFDPLANMRVGTQILKEYIVRAEGSVEAALKSYVGAALLPHDGGYGAKVLFERERIAAAAAGRAQPARPPVTVARAEARKPAPANPAPIDQVVAEQAAATQAAFTSGKWADEGLSRTADLAFRPWVEVDPSTQGDPRPQAAPDPAGGADRDRVRDI